MPKARALQIAVFAGVAWVSVAPARAQDPQYMLASFTVPYARYYAPYALQAAAAYTDVERFNAKSDPSDHIGLAVEAYQAVPNVFSRARDYLRAWRYQFGSTCRRSDPDCWLANSADRRKFEKSGPKFHVWARFPEKYGTACNEVSIAFRGSTLSVRDWISNANPVTRFVFDDHYQRLQRNIDALMQRIARLPCYQGGARIVSTGHSLGGGLAQFAALANTGAVRIDQVVAFDSSPVTGAPMLSQTLREDNARGLEIHRVAQTGEVLIKLRRWAQQYPPDSSPCTRTMIYDVIKPGWSVKLHSMEGLAGGIVAASYSAPTGQYPYTPPPSLAGCDSRYRSKGPANDNDDYDTAKPPVPAPQIAMRSLSARLSVGQGDISTSQGDMAIRYASRDGSEFYSPPEPNAVPVKLERPLPSARLAKHRGSRARIASR